MIMEQKTGGQESGNHHTHAPPSHPHSGQDPSPEQHTPEDSRRSTTILLIAIAVIVMFTASFFAFGYFRSHQRPLTIEELHNLDFQGKLEKSEGYIYHGVYSFVKVDGFWYTALQSQSGLSQYSFAFRYSPEELERLPVSGALDTASFNNASEYYITFNPVAENLSYTVLAVNDYNQHMLNAFSKVPVAACDRNETIACETRPIVTCGSTTGVVVYIRDADTSGVQFGGNCITISGRGFDQVKGVDRVLYKFYNIMG